MTVLCIIVGLYAVGCALMAALSLTDSPGPWLAGMLVCDVAAHTALALIAFHAATNA